MRLIWNDELGEHVARPRQPPGWRTLLANVVDAAGWAWMFALPVD